MTYETVFQRYELKYLLTREQRQAVLRAMEPYMRPDPHSKTTICNLYFDTADYRLIRRSIDSPRYKEKLRIRSYGSVAPESTVFVELKKKLGCTAKILAASLKEMEEDGLIIREQYEENPPKVVYYLTDIGLTLRPVIDSMQKWGQEYKKLRKLMAKMK